MVTKKINDQISYIQGTCEPLSSDIGIINDMGTIWLYDVGDNENVLSLFPEKPMVLLSHFHQDHIGNIDKFCYDQIYLSKQTAKYVDSQNIVEEDTFMGNVHLFLIPSSHSNGSLGLEIGDYAFIGDAIYSKVKGHFFVYNSQKIKEEIDVLTKIKASFFLVSHAKDFVQRKEKVIDSLKEIYAKREKNNPFILIEIPEGIN